MTRTVYLGEGPPETPEDKEVLTPNLTAARSRGVRPLSLEQLAQKTLGEERLASPSGQHRLLEAAVGATLETGDRSGAARTLLPVIRELFRAGTDLSIDPGSPRAREVLRVASAYREELRSAGLLDPSEALREAADSDPQRRALMICAYPRLSPEEVAFVDAVASEGSEVHLPDAGADEIFADNRQAAEDLRDRGWAVKENPQSRTWEPRVQPEAHEYLDRESEVRGTLARVKELLADGTPAAEIALVSRDDASYGPEVLSVAREYGVLVGALYRLPLTRTRLGAWLGLLLEVCEEDFPFETTTHLLAHPLGPEVSDDTWARAQDKTWDEKRSPYPAGAAAWREVGVYFSGERWPCNWPDSDTRSGWAERFERLLDAHGLDDKVQRWPEEETALIRLRESLPSREPSTPFGDERLTRATFVEEVRELLRLTLTPVHPEPEGVALHTPLSSFGTSYRYVFAMGLAEGTFPAPVSDVPELDFHERGKLRGKGIGVELAGERADRERLSFWMLLQVPTVRLTLSYPKHMEDRQALPSPYFKLLGLEPAPAIQRIAASPQEARRDYLRRECPAELEDDPVLDHARHALEVEERRESEAPFDHYDGALGVPLDLESREFSASQLVSLLRCPFQWWSRSVLGLKEEPQTVDFKQVLGTLYHDTLERAVKEVNEEEDLRQGVLDNLETAFSRAEAELREKELGGKRLPGWTFRREECMALLRRAVEAEDFAAPGAKPEQVEADFQTKWRGLNIRGRIDRADRTPEGSIILLDYKSGRDAPRPNLQLTIYKEAAVPHLFGEQTIESSAYYSLSEAKRIEKEPPEAEIQGHLDEIKRLLSGGHLSPDALIRDSGQPPCRMCDFDSVCRKGDRIYRKANTSGGGER